jgi:ubiquinone/menaquinone biosynthesis C-methylase UbiE
MKSTQANTREHFNTISAHYDQEIPEHVRQYLCQKKTGYIIRELNTYGPRHDRPLRGLDAGCGTGWHVRELRKYGFEVSGVDIAEGMITEAKRNVPDASFAVASATELPFEAASFDFVYFINVLHHLPSRHDQHRALQEASRAVKDNGLILVLEMNCQNAAFRFYNNYIFPLTSKIDDDQAELWIPFSFYAQEPQLQVIHQQCFTFIPNFVPRLGFKAMSGLDQLLDRITRNQVGAHYCVTLKKKRTRSASTT